MVDPSPYSGLKRPRRETFDGVSPPSISKKSKIIVPESEEEFSDDENPVESPIEPIEDGIDLSHRQYKEDSTVDGNLVPRVRGQVSLLAELLSANLTNSPSRSATAATGRRSAAVSSAGTSTGTGSPSGAVGA